MHESYRAGSLFGAVTPEPKASIAVPLDAWKTLGDDERAVLMHYAASLVEPMSKDPLTDGKVVRRILEHLGLPTTAPVLAPARSPPELEFAG